MKADKAIKKTKASAPKRELKLPNDEPLHLDMTFEEAIKRAVNSPLKNSKIYKKR